MSNQSTTIANGDLNGFAKEVRTAIMRFVNDFGIKYRLVESGNILLYPKDPHGRPFRVTTQRDAKDSLRYMRKFAEDNDLLPKEEPKRVPAEKVKVSPAQIEPPTSGVVTADGFILSPGGWVRHHRNNGTVTNFERFDEPGGDKRWRCLLCKKEGNDWETTRGQALGSHTSMTHTKPMLDPEIRQRMIATRRAKQEERTKQGLIHSLAELLGTSADDEEMEALKDENERLVAEVADLRARLDLIGEALRA